MTGKATKENEMANDKEIEKWIIRVWGLILLGFGIAIGWRLHP